MFDNDNDDNDDNDKNDNDNDDDGDDDGNFEVVLKRNWEEVEEELERPWLKLSRGY